MQQIAADRHCFVCGPENEAGLKASFQIEPEQLQATTRLVIGASHQGWQGVVHGGIITALLDEAAIYACRPLSMHAVTASLAVRFRKPVQTGQQVTVTAQVVSQQRRMVTVNSRIVSGDMLMADAEIRVMLLENVKDSI